MDPSWKFLSRLSFVCVQLLCVSGLGVVQGPIQLSPIPCNDKAVEKLSRLAVTYINEDRTDGYKFALNRVANVHLHAQGPAGNVYYLDLDVLETKCHIGSPKPWKRCDIRPFMETQISGNCNTTILHNTEGYSYLYSYDCTLVPDPPEKLQQTCPTCPILLPVDSPEAVAAATLSLLSYKSQSTLAAGLGLQKITRAATQTVPVRANFVEYTVQECPEGLTERSTCQRFSAASDTETAGFCTGAVYGDLGVYSDIHASCEMFKLQNVDILTPVQPQGHDLSDPMNLPLPSDPGSNVKPAPSDPGLLPSAAPEVPAAPVDTFDPMPFNPVPYDPVPDKPVPFNPVPADPVPVNPVPVAPVPFDPAPVDAAPFNPYGQLTSSSSESSESVALSTQQQQQPPPAAGPVSSSEELGGGVVALRPPFDFRYQRSDRRRRQALPEDTPTHRPIFLSDFPSSVSPFRSCPGPSRYTTV